MHTNCSLVTANDLGTIENKPELCLIPLNTIIKNTLRCKILRIMRNNTKILLEFSLTQSEHTPHKRMQ